MANNSLFQLHKYTVAIMYCEENMQLKHTTVIQLQLLQRRLAKCNCTLLLQTKNTNQNDVGSTAHIYCLYQKAGCFKWQHMELDYT